MLETTRTSPAGWPAGPMDELVFVWDAEVVTKEDYAALFAAFGDLVRAAGGAGVERRNGVEVDLEAMLAGQGR